MKRSSSSNVSSKSRARGGRAVIKSAFRQKRSLDSPTVVGFTKIGLGPRCIDCTFDLSFSKGASGLVVSRIEAGVCFPCTKLF